jgi:hypothetical protein
MPASPTSERSPDGSDGPVSVEDIVSQAVRELRHTLPTWRSVVASDITASKVSGLGGAGIRSSSPSPERRQTPPRSEPGSKLISTMGTSTFSG